MAEITRRRSGELLRGVFKILLDEPEGLPAKVVLSKMPEVVPPTEFELTTYEKRPDKRRYEKIIRFSTITPVKAGWLVKNKGQWLLTDEGRQAYEQIADPEAFYRESWRRYKKWRADQPSPTPQDEEPPPDELTEDAATVVEEAEEAAWSQIEEYLQEMNPYDFQHLVAGLLDGMGYHISWISPPGPDKGLDVLAYGDPLGIGGPRIKVQVKRRSDRSAVDAIRSFLAVLGDGDVGIFVATGGFTKDAEAEARGQEKRRIMLIDLKRLFDLWVEYYGKIPEDRRRLLPLKAIHYLAPAE